MAKLRVAVLYGGRSGEHEISLQSAASVIRNLDPERFEIIPIGIDREGRWHLSDGGPAMLDGARSLPIFRDAPAVVLPPYGGEEQVALMPLGGAGEGRHIDVVFPVMHGPLCEDGSVQGLCELADVAYVGSGVLASAIGMDKDVAKRLAAAAGIPVVPWLALRKDKWDRERENGAPDILRWIAENLGYPVFVKPANMGSSVGVHKVKEESGLAAALDDAFRFDLKVLVERGIDAREIELSVLEHHENFAEPLVSVPGEIAPSHEFYSYEAKYLDEHGAALMIPADVSDEQAARARQMAADIFTVLECEGMARVDLFLDRQTGAFYFNEINTIPGFTTISMYPKLWEVSGISYSDLLARLIELAIARHQRRRQLVRDRA